MLTTSLLVFKHYIQPDYLIKLHIFSKLCFYSSIHSLITAFSNISKVYFSLPHHFRSISAFLLTFLSFAKKFIPNLLDYYLYNIYFSSFDPQFCIDNEFSHAFPQKYRKYGLKQSYKIYLASNISRKDCDKGNDMQIEGQQNSIKDDCLKSTYYPSLVISFA